MGYCYYYRPRGSFGYIMFIKAAETPEAYPPESCNANPHAIMMRRKVGHPSAYLLFFWNFSVQTGQYHVPFGSLLSPTHDQ